MPKIILNNRLKKIFLLIIPLIFLAGAFLLKTNQGPYYIGFQYDPSYAYLISSLNMAQMSGIEVKHIDHPGTPVQMIGAGVICTVHYIKGNESDIVEDVLLNPEEYLSYIDFTLIIINSIGLIILGVISYKLFSSISKSLLLQLFPFTSVSILSLLNYVRPENFLIFIVSIFIASLLMFVKNLSNDIMSKKHIKYILLIGVICGLGTAAKLTFIPLIVIPLVLFRSIKFKVIFVSVIVVSFLIFISPVLTFSNANYFYHWVINIFIFTKRYGKGEPDFVDPVSFLGNFKKIITHEIIFDSAYLCLIFSILLYFLSIKGNMLIEMKGQLLKEKIYFVINKIIKILFGDIWLRFALGLLVAMTLQILIVAKHYGENYMFPALTLSCLAFFVSINIVTSSGIISKRIFQMAYFAVIIVILVYGTYIFYNRSEQLKYFTEESEKLQKYIDDNSSQAIVTTTVHIPSKEFALLWGVNYAGSQIKKYSLILSHKFPSSIMYFKFKCYSFNEDPLSISKMLAGTKRILFVSSDENYKKEFLEILQNENNAVIKNFKKVYTNGNSEMVYEINIIH